METNKRVRTFVKSPAFCLYPFNLRDRIPVFQLPLQSNDEEPIVDLYEILQEVYEEAALDLVIDYFQQPVPPVTEETFQWIQTLLTTNQ